MNDTAIIIDLETDQIIEKIEVNELDSCMPHSSTSRCGDCTDCLIIDTYNIECIVYMIDILDGGSNGYSIENGKLYRALESEDILRAGDEFRTTFTPAKGYVNSPWYSNDPVKKDCFDYRQYRREIKELVEVAHHEGAKWTLVEAVPFLENCIPATPSEGVETNAYDPTKFEVPELMTMPWEN